MNSLTASLATAPSLALVVVAVVAHATIAERRDIWYTLGDDC